MVLNPVFQTTRATQSHSCEALIDIRLSTAELNVHISGLKDKRESEKGLSKRDKWQLLRLMKIKATRVRRVKGKQEKSNEKSRLE